MRSAFVGWCRAAALAAATLALPRIVMAQDSSASRNHLYDKWQVGAAFTTVLNRSDARVDPSEGGSGTTLTFGSLLGLSSTSVQPEVGVRWKPGRHTELDVGYQWINQSGQRTFTDSLVIGNDTLSGDLNLNTKVGSSNATLQFKYSLWAAERHNIGLAVGLGAIFLSLDFTGSASGCAGASCDSTGTFSISKSVTAPTGSLGGFGRWRVGDRWYLGADARGLGATVDRFNVSIFEGDAGAQYFLSDRWGLGLSWYYTNVTVDIAQRSGAANSFSGRVAYAYSSLRLGAVYAF